MKKGLLLIITLLCFIWDGFGIKPDSVYVLTPDSINWSHEKLKIVTDDGFTLSTWMYHPNAESDKDTVLILAGPDAGNMSYFVYHSMVLAYAGYTIVTFDYRGFGESSDFDIQRNYLYHTEFSTDLEAVVNTVSDRFSDKQIGIWSLSMGTAITSRTFPQIKNKIDFIIGEAYITDTSYIIDRYAKKDKNLTLPETARRYKRRISKIDVPLLVLAASEDQITTLSDAEELRKKLGKSCTVLEYPGAHVQGFQYQVNGERFGEWYTQQIDDFLSEI